MNKHFHINGQMLQEAELVDQCKKGKRASQKALYELYCQKMMVVCMRYAKSIGEAEDILQEGFIKVFHHIKNFRSEATLSTWITRIMINTALNANRKKVYLYPMVDVVDVKIQVTDSGIDQLHFNELLEMIQNLPTGCQAVFNMYAIDGYGHKEIAEELGISEGTSKSQYARARQLLQRMIETETLKLSKYGETIS
jgi:RNA polymerase sigma-70 factor (ECF subfamily)